jgi:hypothetical protein
MSATSGYGLRSSSSYAIARQRALQRTLEHHGVLTRHGLFELAHAEHWSVPFDVALERAVAAGRVCRLDRDLYAAGPRRN